MFRRVVGAFLAVALWTGQACYVYAPVYTAQPAGTALAFDLNDRGRVAMGDLVGPSAARIEGRLRTEDDTVYVVNVTSVTYLTGQTNQWAGETVSVPKVGIASVRERQFSRARTALAVGGAVAAVVGFIISRDVFGSSPPPVEPPIDEPPDQT